MDSTGKAMLWSQFGASIDMLENAIRTCPDELWRDRTQRPEFWYVAFHTLFFLDLYLSGTTEGFAPPPPFTLDELDPAGILPERVYAKGEILAYLDHGRAKGRATIAELTEEQAQHRCIFPWGKLSFEELLWYNMRHVQHHAAQLNLILRQQVDDAPGWVARTRSPLM